MAIPHSRPRRFSAVRSPVRTARAGPSISASTAGGAVDDGAVLSGGLHVDGGVERAEDRGGGRDAADDAGLLEQQLRAAAEVLGDERVGGHVAVADVLGERELDDPVDRLGRQLHRSSSTAAPGADDEWPASASSSTGKSSRKWTPRLSVRASALSAIRRRSGAGASSSRVRPAALRIRPASCQSALRSSGGHRLLRLQDASAAPAAGLGLRQRGQRGAPAEDEALEQRVRGEPVRAVHAGAGALACGVEAGNACCLRRDR